MRLFFISIFMMLSVICSSVSAQSTATDSISTLSDIPNVELIPLKKGVVAPLAGVLLPPVAIAAIIAEFEQFNERLKIELDKANRDADANLQFKIAQLTTETQATQKILTTRIDNATKYNASLLEQLNKAEKSKPSRRFWYTLGVVTGVVVTGAAAFAVERALH